MKIVLLHFYLLFYHKAVSWCWECRKLGCAEVTVSKSLFDGTLTATPSGTGDIRLGAIVGWSNPSCSEIIESCFENGKYNGITDNAQTAFCRKYDSTMPELSNLPWFTLDGRRLQAQPTQSGIYIQGGRKVVIQ